MEEQKENRPNRKQILDAIDFEITHRETLLSRHGISTWGIIAACCALLWAATNESLNSSHDLTNVFVVLLVSQMAYGTVFSPWLKPFLNLRGVSANTIKELAMKLGVEQENVPHFLGHAGLMFLIGLYLGFHGFVLLAVTTCSVYFLAFLFISFCAVALRLQFPLKRIAQNPKTRPQLRVFLITRTLTFLLMLVPFVALISAMPISVPDARLGLMLAALLSLWGLSLTLLKPPTATAGLRDLRSKLSFDEITCDEALAKAKFILRGSPEEYYLTSKADEAIAEFREFIQLRDLAVEQTEEMLQLAEKLRSHTGDNNILKEVTMDFRDIFTRMRNALSNSENHMAAGLEFRRQLMLRMKIAQIWLPNVSKARDLILKQVDDAIKSTAVAQERLRALQQQSSATLEFLHEAQKHVVLPRRLTLSELFEACFRP